MYRFFLIPIAFFFCLNTDAQTIELSLEECLEKAEAHSPVLAVKPLIAEQLVAKTKRLNRSFWPQMALNAKATWQSDVLSIPISFPGVEIPSQSADQYGVNLDIQQILWDGGVMNAQKQLSEAMSEVSVVQADINFHEVKGQIIQLFFGALLAEQKGAYLKLVSGEIERQLDRLNYAVENGIAIVSDQQQLQAKLLELNMGIQEAEANKTAALLALEQWTGMPISKDSKLTLPTSSFEGKNNQRAELRQLDASLNVLQANEQLLKASNLPKIGAFAQLGYGQPGLNPLSSEWDSYAIIGAKLSVPLTWMYSGSQRLDVQQLELQKRQVSLQKEQINIQLTTGTIAQKQEVLRLQALVSADEQLIALREDISKTVAVQLEEGIKTVTDYLSAVNNEELAKQNHLLHQVQEMQAIALYNWIKK